MLKAWSTKQFSGRYAELAYEGEVRRVPALLPSILQWSPAETELAKADWARLKPGLSFSDWLGALIARAGERLHSKQGARLEYYYQAAAALELNGKREIAIAPFGRADIITATHCIEVKHAGQFKHALGQALCYAHATSLQAGLVIYAEHDIMAHAEQICKKYNASLWAFDRKDNLIKIA